MFLFMALGMEIYISMGVASMAYLLIATDTPLNLIATNMVKGIDNYTLLAIPFFILTGELMNLSGITLKLVNFSRFFIGQWRGGLAYTSVVVNVISAGVSGSAPADCSAVSSVMLPAMKKDGYREDFSAAINAAASTIGPIIPPSIPMIFLAMITNLSVGKLFLGGVIPGLLMGASLMIILYFLMRKDTHLPVYDFKRTWKGFWEAFKDAFFALLAPIIILVGVISGVVTVSEVAILAAAYVMFVGLFITRTIKLKNLVEIFSSTAIFSSTIMMLFSIVGIFAWIMAAERVGDALGNWFQIMNLGSYSFLFLVNIFFLIVGMVMDALPAMLIFVPVLLPISAQLGIDPIHFGVVIVLNLMIGLVTPPVGGLLYIVSKIGRVPFQHVSRASIPFIGALLAVLFLITYIPGLVTWIPKLIMGS
jgi:tripartite ATP-independent transporter DctM subunit